MYGASQIGSGISNNDILPEDSYLLSFQKMEEKYFEGINSELEVVFQTFDYTNPECQDEMLRIANGVRNSGILTAPVRFWFERYLDWLAHSYHNRSLTPQGRPPTSELFYLWLYEWITIPEDGMQYLNDIVFQFGAIKTSKLSTKQIYFPTDFDRANAITRMREITASNVIQAFPYCWKYIFW